MDNLTFHTREMHKTNECEQSDEQATEQATEVKTDEKIIQPLIVYTINRRNVKYEVVVCDFQSCQFPRQFLTPEVCRETIIDSISDVEYTYDTDLNTISLLFNIIPKKGLKSAHSIKLTLKPQATTLDDSHVRFERIEAAIDSLDHYEIIETHYYPKWDSPEEFTRLHGFKYFEAAYNQASFHKDFKTKFDGSIRKYIGKFKNLHYNFHGCSIVKNGDTFPDILDNSDDFYGEYNIADVVDRELDISIKRANEQKIEHRPKFYLYTASYKVLHNDSYQTSWAVAEYAKNYLRGWLLINHELIIFRRPIIYIDIRKNSMCITIKRAKYMRLNHIIGYITQTNYDGVFDGVSVNSKNVAEKPRIHRIMIDGAFTKYGADSEL